MSKKTTTRKTTVKKDIDRDIKQLTDYQHAIKFVDYHIGKTVAENEERIIVKPDGNAELMIVYNRIKALEQIINEPLTNAMDNSVRPQKPAQTYIKIQVFNDPAKDNFGIITIENNGRGIPLKKLDSGLWSVQVAFSELKSGSNYETTERRVAGQYGLGVKLTNIFSDYFKVENIDMDSETKYTQVFKSTGKELVVEEPTIEELKTKPETGMVKITFRPNYKFFIQKAGIPFDKGTIKQLVNNVFYYCSNRAYEMAFTVPNNTVSFNDKTVPIKSFEKYINLIFKNKSEFVFDSNSETKWEVGMSHGLGLDRNAITFINGVQVKEGKHLDYFVGKYIAFIKDKFKNRQDLTNAKIKNEVFFFMNIKVMNPEFSDQIKENLTKYDTEPSFTALPKFFDAFFEKAYKKLKLKDIYAANVNDLVLDELEKNLAKQKKKKKSSFSSKHTDPDPNVPKKDRILIIVEGNSALTTAESALRSQLPNPERFGLYALRGKLLNPLQKPKKLAKSEGIQELLEYIGITVDRKGSGSGKDARKSLNFHKLIIMTDQDVDGFHIRGLLINLINFVSPKLLSDQDFNFIHILSTPIIRVTPKVRATKDEKKSRSRNNVPISFYTEQDYVLWAEENKEILSRYETLYFKGLAGMTEEISEEIFTNFEEFLTEVIYDKHSQTDIFKAFGKDTSLRKNWLNEYEFDDYVNLKEVREITISDILNKQLIHFEQANNIRNLPSLYDGLKPSQRKIIFASIDMNINSGTKVADLASKISSSTSYHHGPTSLEDTLKGMGSCFTGNNLNLMIPTSKVSGFGSRWKPNSKDMASSRYTFVKLNNIVNILFPKIDNNFLEFLEDDGLKIEPKYYVPIIPLVFIFGVNGIGTGWSTSIPPLNIYNIIKVIKKIISGNLIGKINDDELEELLIEHFDLWIEGFTGKIVMDKSSETGMTSERIKYFLIGNYTYNKTNGEFMFVDPPPFTETIKPLGRSAFSGKSEDDDDDKKKEKGTRGKANKIASFFVDGDVRLIVDSKTEMSFKGIVKTAYRSDFAKLENGLANEVSLLNSINMCYTVGFGNINVIQDNYSVLTVNYFRDVFKEWFIKRQEIYHKRYAMMIKNLKRIIVLANNRYRFIKMIIDEKLVIKNLPNVEAQKLLEKNNFDKDEGTYNYLLSMPIWSFTKEKLEELKKKIEKAEKDLADLEKRKPNDFWIEELDNLTEALVEMYKARKELVSRKEKKGKKT